MTLLQCDLPNIRKLRSGKVREVFDLGDCVLFVTTDRISAFDSVFPNGIPGKGKILNQCSAFWFQYFTNIPNHLITIDVEKYPNELKPHLELLAGRSMIVKKTKPLPVECVVRGYLAGSGWKEYQENGTLAGIKLPKGLRNAEALPEPMFTPSTKAEEGHDEPITWEQCCHLIGQEKAEQVRAMSLQLYTEGAHYARERGIIIADTKFEFGVLDGKIILIDECMTPDSSRFWPIDEYEVGKNPPSFDKQFLRDYLEASGWNKLPPAPELPEEIVLKTAQKYQEAFSRLAAV
ncbi:MAG: phosphoribosylaminoimidazolesuccinocarboxamide synthase [Verrucomicrobia bacterium]|nr:phosphoribosylaminoimidazolesuccinocarboxamide synthase [Verrucomicrobiota bacterium]